MLFSFYKSGRSFAVIILAMVFNFSQAQTDSLNGYGYDIEDRIEELGIELTDPNLPPGLNILLVKQTDKLVFLSGNGPLTSDGTKISGKVGRDLSVEEGYQAARLTGINQLSVLKAHLGDLNRVVRIVKVLGLVNADPNFTQQPAVINGFSDLMVEVFGERGKHARSAVGAPSLPWDLACEVEMIVEVSQ